MIVVESAAPASAPEPRLTARSMLSLGTDDFLAFWIASYSVGFPATSPPPMRAATSMFLISLANILPRRASITAFLCLVVAHFEWPDMHPSSSVDGRGRRPCGRPHELQEQAVDPGVTTHLGMERRRHERTLADRHDPTGGGTAVDPGEHLDLWPGLLDPGCPDEDRVHRLLEPG